MRVFHFLGQSIKAILLISIVVSILYSLGALLINGYSNLFFIKNVLVSANLNDFYMMTLKNKDECKPGEIYGYPFELDLLSAPKYAQDYKIESDNPIRFSITFPDGILVIKTYKNDGSQSETTIQVNEGEGYSGSVGEFYIQNTSDTIMIKEDICAQEILYSPDVGLLSIRNGDPQDYQAVFTQQTIRAGDVVTISISKPTNFEGFSQEDLSKIVFVIKPDTDYQALSVFSGSIGMEIDLPNLGKSFSTQNEQPPSSWLRAFPEEITIEQPSGKIKIGNEESIILGGLTEINDEELTFQKSILPTKDYAIFGRIEAAEYEIAGSSTGLVLNSEQLVKSPWDKLPDYVKSALFAVFLAGIGGVWKFRSSVWSLVKSLNPFGKSLGRKKPEKGSFICVTNTGMMIAGELSRKPSKNYPYYLIKNAQRKFIHSDQWEPETISDVKIRADAVEQSYVL